MSFLLELESDFDGEAFMEHFTDQVLLPAALAAAEVIGEQVENNLQPHRGDQTGTTDQQSAETKTEMSGLDALADSVETAISGDGASVFIEGESAFKGAWLEFGHQAVYWGMDSGEAQPPNPFMRTAYETAKGRAMSKFMEVAAERISGL